jgi:hypothetical protein
LPDGKPVRASKSEDREFYNSDHFSKEDKDNSKKEDKDMECTPRMRQGKGGQFFL